MKVLCGITSRNDSILHIKDTLLSMGHTVLFFSTDCYDDVSSYPAKKLDHMGFHRGKNAFLQRWKAAFWNCVYEEQPDVCLFINTPTFSLTPMEMKALHEKTTVVCQFVDSVMGGQDKEYLPYYDRIFVFEKGDIDYLREQYGVTATYCPVGYNAAFAAVGTTGEKDVDIAFVGSPFKNRLHILEQLCAHAAKHQWNVKLYGPFYEEKYFWKKYIFRRRYPWIARYLTNGAVMPEDVARLYKRSKICLNIHLPKHKGVNPRTFEIMAAGSFQLTDVREDYAGLIPGRDMDVFHSTEELVEKITYYLAHDNEREQIAAQGQKAVLGRYSMEAGLHHVLNGGAMER